MSDYEEIHSMLTNRPITKKQVTIGASVRLPVAVLADIQAMANRVKVSRNEIMAKLLASAVSASHMALIESGDTDVLAELQEDAENFKTGFWESYDPIEGSPIEIDGE